MSLSGKQLIGNHKSASGRNTFFGIYPTTGENLPGAFYEATAEEINQAVELAEKAFISYRNCKPNAKADFLEKIAEEILALGDVLVDRAMLETALPKGRIEGERGRTMSQLKLFAEVVREGSWVDARVDHLEPDIRQMARPLGPVAIFGASNFPLAFSVAGGDTASALAAGCPVVIKAHPAHPGTSELVGGAIIRAAQATGMPEGVCSILHGVSHEVGGAMVTHPLVTAVGFTGSYRGGKALFDRANARPTPIPVFAEMGSTNPVFILPGALRERGAEIGTGLAGSVTLGVGQFCTNPGLVFISDSPSQASLSDALSKAIMSGTAGTMLTSGIRTAYESGVDHLAETTEISAVATGQRDETTNAVAAKIFQTSLDAYLGNQSLQEEVFGPSTILVRGDSREKLMEAANNLTGHLTATVHGTAEDLLEYQDLLSVLERKVGRIVINGFPTGVAVCHAMVHGGPFPATTAPNTTSVGTNAIKRFVRPVCYQGYPKELLPAALQDDNPLGIWRMVDGKMGKE